MLMVGVLHDDVDDDDDDGRLGIFGNPDNCFGLVPEGARMAARPRSLACDVALGRQAMCTSNDFPRVPHLINLLGPPPVPAQLSSSSPSSSSSFTQFNPIPVCFSCNSILLPCKPQSPSSVYSEGPLPSHLHLHVAPSHRLDYRLR
jgi:hypothetical protein